MWQKSVPTEEGWYFWRKRINQKDPWTWTPIFVIPNDDTISGKPITSFWDGTGTNITCPAGGQWSIGTLKINNPTIKLDCGGLNEST